MEHLLPFVHSLLLCSVHESQTCTVLYCTRTRACMYKRNLIHASIPYLALVSCEPTSYLRRPAPVTGLSSCIEEVLRDGLASAFSARNTCHPRHYRYFSFFSALIFSSGLFFRVVVVVRPDRSVSTVQHYCQFYATGKYLGTYWKVRTKRPPLPSAPTQNRTPSCRSIMAC
ncbi:hypothetical protein J3E69DRAFT_77012 [Trichoderma sp. SZMC 28015]